MSAVRGFLLGVSIASIIAFAVGLGWLAVLVLRTP